MTSILFLGLLLGMQHALEADHVAAVASIAARQTSVRRIVAHGAVWGIGHMAALVAFAGSAIVLGAAVGDQLAGWLEAAVGVMLVGLGGHVIYRLIRDRVHFHLHRHADGVVHFHAHSHAGDVGEHARSAHRHQHRHGLPWRSLWVGLMHGAAGSAALLVLSASAMASPAEGLLYVALFGAGSVVGMAALSAVIAVPIAFSASALTWANRSLQAAVGVGTVAIGLGVLGRIVVA